MTPLSPAPRRYAIRPARGDRALADVIAMVQQLLDETRALVASGVPQLEAAERVIRSADLKAVTGAAYLSLLAAIEEPAREAAVERPN